jgi:hypothetical protein
VQSDAAWTDNDEPTSQSRLMRIPADGNTVSNTQEFIGDLRDS